MNKRSFLRSLAGAVMAVAMAKSLGATEPAAFLEGRVDDLRVYNYELNPEWIGLSYRVWTG